MTNYHYRQLRFNLNEEVYLKLKAYCKENKKRMNKYIQSMLENSLSQIKPTPENQNRVIIIKF